MDNFLEKLKKSNKIVFYALLIITLPIILLFLFKDIVLKLIASSAETLVKKAREKDRQLKDSQDMANDEANRHKKRADELNEAAKQAQKNEEEDWHKKGSAAAGIIALILGLSVVGFELYNAYINHVPRLKKGQCIFFNLNEAKRIFSKESQIIIPVLGLVSESDPLNGEYVIINLSSEVFVRGVQFNLSYFEERRLKKIKKIDNCFGGIESEK